MSRSGYVDDIDNLALINWRGAVKSAIQGKRGQAFLRALVDALDAMPETSLGRIVQARQRLLLHAGRAGCGARHRHGGVR